MTKRTEFSQALKAIATERGLDAELIIEAIRQAYVAAYKRDAKERGEEVDNFDHEAVIDTVTGEAKIMAWEVEEIEEDKDGENEANDDEEVVVVRKMKKGAKRADVTPPGFGRIAAQTAKQVIHQKIREAEKGAIMDEFSGRMGGLISGIILRFDGSNVRVDLGRTEGIMPSGERVPNERLNSGQRLTFLLKEINETMRGKQIILSRADMDFVRKIFEREVPEIGSGSVEIKGIARDPGVRTKIAVSSIQSGVDPVGSCVGQKGVRVQAVTNELGGERIDIIPWTEDEEEFLQATLSPVEVLKIKLNKDEKTASVIVPEDQLSLAIGKDGQNVRLASQITGYKIEVEGKPEKGKKKVEKEEEEKVEEKKEKKVKKVKKVKTEAKESKKSLKKED